MSQSIHKPVSPRRARLTFVTAVLLLPALACVTSGCGLVYRINIQQGNYLDQDTIDLIEPGMTQSQVRFLLGTPMISDPFNDDRWDYVYFFRPGKTRRVVKRRFIVYFDGEVVARTEAELPAAESDQ